MLFDRELRYLAADGPCLADFDLSSEAVVGKSVEDLFSGETRERIRLHYEAALGGEERAWEVRRNGRVYSLSAGPIADQSGRVESGMVIVQDVTERARAEAEQAALRRVATIIAEDAGAPANETRRSRSPTLSGLQNAGGVVPELVARLDGRGSEHDRHGDAPDPGDDPT